MCYVSSLCRKGDIFPYNHTQGKKRVGKSINCIPSRKKNREKKKLTHTKKRVGSERHLLLIFLIHRARKGTELRGTSDTVVVIQSGKKFSVSYIKKGERILPPL